MRHRKPTHPSIHSLISITTLLFLQRWEDLELVYAGQRMADGRHLADYRVPPVGGWVGAWLPGRRQEGWGGHGCRRCHRLQVQHAGAAGLKKA